ncbi:MAG: 3-methyl-2-oxobutanoatehydroxymethyltransferase [Ilumatobacteraceae bacterium]|nr:3-methyl-2-oxobutanoatehydroxymethyltransferase [Ilumatobacteraceae bacterium]
MSSPPRAAEESAVQPVRLPDLAAWAADGKRLVMITAYDFPSAQIVDAAGVDMVLVGDSAANVVLGYPSTVAVSIDEMLVLVRAVRRGTRRPLLIADLPFGSYEVSDEDAVRTAVRFVKEGGADAVKLERGGTSVARAAAIVAAGIPVVGHVGLTPQTAVVLGGYRAQGRNTDAALQITRDALALEAAGCFCVVVEAVPAAVAAHVASLLAVPVVGIGAGRDVGGQVLVLHDMLGVTPGTPPRFVRRYAELRSTMTAAVRQYASDVRDGSFPTDAHTYPIAAEQLAAYLDVAPSPAT